MTRAFSARARLGSTARAIATQDGDVGEAGLEALSALLSWTWR
ncbi:hypothetical protein [uncultured Microbacterium sp.]|nr:hypothetical protein [uncultured Microbacterium sp.]